MVIDIANLVKVGGSFLAFCILVFIGVSGFRQNTKKHNKNGGEK